MLLRVALVYLVIFAIERGLPLALAAWTGNFGGAPAGTWLLERFASLRPIVAGVEFQVAAVFRLAVAALIAAVWHRSGKAHVDRVALLRHIQLAARWCLAPSLACWGLVTLLLIRPGPP